MTTGADSAYARGRQRILVGGHQRLTSGGSGQLAAGVGTAVDGLDAAVGAADGRVDLERAPTLRAPRFRLGAAVRAPLMVVVLVLLNEGGGLLRDVVNAVGADGDLAAEGAAQECHLTFAVDRAGVGARDEAAKSFLMLRSDGPPRANMARRDDEILSARRVVTPDRTRQRRQGGGGERRACSFSAWFGAWRFDESQGPCRLSTA